LNSKHYLPSKIATYLKRLLMEYKAAEDRIKTQIINESRAYVIEETDYDNWNGGTYGHDVVLYLPIDAFGLFRLSQQNGIEANICSDLNTLATNIENEFFHAVRLEIRDEDSPGYQRAIGVTGRPTINPDSLSIWKPGLIRTFISHRDAYKKQAKLLADSLEPYGISSFVAHETIEPTKEWRLEIMNGLQTMEIMLAFVTDDFHTSTWTNQEVGFALVRGVPVVSLKVEKNDPPGFIGHEQALRGILHSPDTSASKIHKLLGEKLGQKDRIQSGLVNAFNESPNWSETTSRFDRMSESIEKLSDAELSSIIDSYSKNDQLHGAAYLNNRSDRLRKFLAKTTGSDFIISGKLIIDAKLQNQNISKTEEDIPF